MLNLLTIYVISDNFIMRKLDPWLKGSNYFILGHNLMDLVTEVD